LVQRRKKNSKLKIILIILFSIILIGGVALGGSYLFLRSKLSKVKTVTIPKDPAKLGIDSTKVPTGTDVVNILLMGIDARNPKDPGHSDSMMILTVDNKHQKLKLTSIMRDSYVNIDGYKPQKITNAHQFGGALLSLKTVNENYQMNIKDYIQVNFFGLEKIIDSMGGVPINVDASEISFANSSIYEVARIEHKVPTPITKPGLQILNGAQAVGYSRIRYVGNNDFQRTDRQRTVLTALFKKLFSTNMSDIPSVADTITPYIETSLKTEDMMSLATYILTHRITNIEQSRVPYDGLYKNAVIDRADVLVWDKDATIQRLHQFIFESVNN
jgi:LCP family protein required for cell wall assembly